MFDGAVRAFIKAPPDGVIVNLGEGLETQRYRIKDDEGVLWISVDVPEAIAIRERFIAPDDRHLHVATSALDEGCFEAAPEGRPAFVPAQGHLMYFTEGDVRGALQAISGGWPGVRDVTAFSQVP